MSFPTPQIFKPSAFCSSRLPACALPWPLAIDAAVALEVAEDEARDTQSGRSSNQRSLPENLRPVRLVQQSGLPPARKRAAASPATRGAGWPSQRRRGRRGPLPGQGGRPEIEDGKAAQHLALQAARAEAGGGVRGPLPGEGGRPEAEDGKAAQRAALQAERARWRRSRSTTR